MPTLVYDQSIPSCIRKQYSRAKAQAKYRREEWAFTAESWYAKWQESGRIEHRGSKPHHFCMVRLDSIEAWSPKNTIIVSRRLHMRKGAYEQFGYAIKTDWQPKHDASAK